MHRASGAVGAASAAGCNRGRISSGGRGTLRPTADATWRSEMSYRRFLVRQLRVVVIVEFDVDLNANSRQLLQERV